MTRLAFVDAETTGLDPDRHEVWEVGLVLTDDVDLFGTATEYVWQLPVDLTVADPMGLAISGFHDRHPHGYGVPKPGLVGGPTPPADFADEFCQLTYKAHLVGAVPSFDDERLRKLLARWGYAPAWHYHLIDVEAMAVGWLHGRYRDERWPAPDDDKACLSLPWRSDDLSRACGVEPPSEDERHTALGDARWAWRWYCALVGDDW